MHHLYPEVLAYWTSEIKITKPQPFSDVMSTVIYRTQWCWQAVGREKW